MGMDFSTQKKISMEMDLLMTMKPIPTIRIQTVMESVITLTVMTMETQLRMDQ